MKVIFDKSTTLSFKDINEKIDYINAINIDYTNGIILPSEVNKNSLLVSLNETKRYINNSNLIKELFRDIK